MGKVRLIVALIVLILIFLFALFNSGQGYTTKITFFLKNWTIESAPVWGVIIISLAIGLFFGYLLRGGRRKHKKEHE
jgi:uncharacterized integral membrane protein